MEKRHLKLQKETQRRHPHPLPALDLVISGESSSPSRSLELWLGCYGEGSRCPLLDDAVGIELAAGTGSFATSDSDDRSDGGGRSGGGAGGDELFGWSQHERSKQGGKID